jgi:hypothetical protein
MDIWPFRDKRNRPTSPLQQDVDYSKDNPYYSLANSLALAVNDDPIEGESLEEFLDRFCGDTELFASDLDKCQEAEKAWPPKFDHPPTNREYFRRKAQLEKFLKSLNAVKDEEWRTLLSRRAEYLAQLKENIIKGEPIEHKPELLADYIGVSARIFEELRDAELESIQKQIGEGLEPSFNSNLISIGEVEQVKKDTIQTKKLYWREIVKNQLLESEDLEFDNQYVSKEEVQEIVDEISSERFQWLHSRQRPSAQPYGVSNYGAEQLVADWLVYLGCQDVFVTQASQDGGVDVETESYVCQVKYYKNQGVSVQEAREIFGVASAAGKGAMIFTSSDLTAAAYEFANQVGLIAVQFNVEGSFLVGLNYYGEQLLVEGEYE